MTGNPFAEGDSYADWAMWEGNYRLRNIAANLMGHAPPRAGGSEVAAMTSNTEDRILNSIIATGELQDAGLSDEQLQTIGRLVLNARKGIRDINFADEDAPDLYRGIEAPDGSEILDLEAGDSFVLTLSAFSPSENMASGFAGLPFGSEVWTPEAVGKSLSLMREVNQLCLSLSKVLKLLRPLLRIGLWKMIWKKGYQ